MSEPQSGPPAEFQTFYDHVATCSRCGFCQPACPIFRATGREGHVARGKMALYRNVIEERTEIGPDMRDAFSNCLQCRACTESCFSALETDEVVRSFRHAYAERFGRSFWQRRVFRSLLPRPRVMRALVRSIWALRKTGLADAAKRIGLVGLLNPKLERALDLHAGTPGPLLHDRLAKRPPPAPGGRPLVGYWMSCGYNYVLPEVGEATVRVLERMGVNVEVLDNCCCGLAAHGYGDREAAERLARENLRRLGDLERFDAIVSECGSCSGHLKEYPEDLGRRSPMVGAGLAFEGQGEELQRVRRRARRVTDSGRSWRCRGADDHRHLPRSVPSGSPLSERGGPTQTDLGVPPRPRLP